MCCTFIYQPIYMQCNKTVLVVTVILGTVLLFTECSSTDVQNKKDLDENMIDMMMYHDNLGLYLRKKDSDNAVWLLEGMDSSLRVIADKFDEHRKLEDPFRKYYKKLLVPPIKSIRKALQKNDFSAAILSYQVLTEKCNDCHIDHDVDKTVIDWSDGRIH